MQRMGERCGPPQWEVLDPTLAAPAASHLMQQILDLVRSDWTLDVTLDLNGAHSQRLLAHHRIATLIPIDRVSVEQRAELRTQQIVTAAAQLKLRSVAVEVLELFARAGIDSRVLKGLATSELDYPNRGLRHTGDVGLAVRPEHIEEAVRLLQAHGYRDHPLPFAPQLLCAERLAAPVGVEVDLHTRLFRYSAMGDRLFTDPGEPLADLPGRALCASHRIVHAAGHLIVSSPGIRRMSGLFDITRIHRHPDLDLEAARDFAAALGVESLVGAGLRIEAVLSGRTDVVGSLDAWEPPDWLERRTKLAPNRNLVLEHLGRYREVQKGQRLRYLPTLLLPDRRQRRILLSSARRSGRRLQGWSISPTERETGATMSVALVNRHDADTAQYRLGDAVLMRSARYGVQAFEMVASNDSMHGSLLHSYAARVDRSSPDPQWPILRQLVRERVAAVGLPRPGADELIAHLRLGKGKGFDQSGGKPEQFVRYVVDVATTEAVDKVALVTAIHFGALHLRRHEADGQIESDTRRAQWVAAQIMKGLSDAGLEVRLHSHEDVDVDFCFLAGSTRFVLGNGHFSLCAAMVSDATVFVPPWSRPGAAVDIDSLLASRAAKPAPGF